MVDDEDNDVENEDDDREEGNEDSPSTGIVV